MKKLWLVIGISRMEFGELGNLYPAPEHYQAYILRHPRWTLEGIINCLGAGMPPNARLSSIVEQRVWEARS